MKCQTMKTLCIMVTNNRKCTHFKQKSNCHLGFWYFVNLFRQLYVATKFECVDYYVNLIQQCQYRNAFFARNWQCNQINEMLLQRNKKFYIYLYHLLANQQREERMEEKKHASQKQMRPIFEIRVSDGKISQNIFRSHDDNGPIVVRSVAVFTAVQTMARKLKVDKGT